MKNLLRKVREKGIFLISHHQKWKGSNRTWLQRAGLGLMVSGILLLSTAVFARTAEYHIEEARKLSRAGDLAAAAVAYQKALKLDQHNSVARRELNGVLIESKRQDPEGEYSEAEWALLEERWTAPKNTSKTHTSNEVGSNHLPVPTFDTE